MEKENIIRLGRSKSQRKSSIQSRRQSALRISKKEQGFMENSAFSYQSNQNHHKSPLQQSNKWGNYSKTHQGGFPKIVVMKKQLNNSTGEQFARTSRLGFTSNSPDQSTQQIITQLQRKNKILQTRIQELHQQKQHSIFKLQQQNKILLSLNQQLEKNFSECQGAKQFQLDKIQRHLGDSFKPFFIRKEQNLYEQSNINEQSQKKEVQKADSILKSIYKQLEQSKQRNQELEKQVAQLKFVVVETLKEVQSSNWNLSEEYNNKSNSLENTIYELTTEKDQLTTEIINLLKQNQWKNQRIKQVEQSIVERDNIETGKNSLVSQITEQKAIIEELKLQKASVENQYNQMKEIPVTQQNCTKCKQLIRTLIKLNQKTISRTK